MNGKPNLFLLCNELNSLPKPVFHTAKFGYLNQLYNITSLIMRFIYNDNSCNPKVLGLLTPF